MRKSYKTLTDAEFNVLNRIAEKTKNDCWFYLKQTRSGTDYVFDLEERKRMCLRNGVALLCEGLDCQENYDNCNLDWVEKVTFRNLLAKLKISVSFDFKLPCFEGMPKEKFLEYFEEAEEKYFENAEEIDSSKEGDRYRILDVCYVFGYEHGKGLICVDIIVDTVYPLSPKYPNSYNDGVAVEV